MAWSHNVVPALENVVPEDTVLNDAKIRAAKPRDKAYKLTDSHRLYLLVKPGGSTAERCRNSRLICSVTRHTAGFVISLPQYAARRIRDAYDCRD
jgi:hypothetical protein